MAKETSEPTRRFARTVLRPLTEREGATAVRSALADVQRATDTERGRLRLFPAELRIEKPAARGEAPTRLIRVRIYDRDQRRFHDVSIGTTGQVVEHLQSDTGAPPLLPDEVAEARRIAASRDEVASLLSQHGVGVEVISAAGHEQGRRAGLRLFRGRTNIEEVGVVEVDLDRGEVLRVELNRSRGGR